MIIPFHLTKHSLNAEPSALLDLLYMDFLCTWSLSKSKIPLSPIILLDNGKIIIVDALLGLSLAWGQFMKKKKTQIKR